MILLKNQELQMIHSKHFQPFETIPHAQIEKLTQMIAKSLFLDEEIASSLIYNEWESVEALFKEHKNIKTVHRHLLDEIDGEYRGFVCSSY